MSNHSLNLLPHEMNSDWMPLFETVETGLSGFRNQMVQFCQDRWQSGAPPTSMRFSSFGQETSGRWRDVNHDNFGDCVGG
jgi:hypothetical protein